MRRFFVLFVVLMMVAACGGNSGGTTTTGSVNLPQTATSEDGTFTLKYPEGWAAQSQLGSQILLANTAELLNNPTLSNFTSGQVAVIAAALPSSGLPQPDMPLKDIAALLANSFSGGNGGLGEPTEFDLNGRPAVSLSGTIKPGDQEIGAYILLVQDKPANTIYNYVVTTAPGEQNNHVELAKAIAASASFTPAATPQN